MCNRNSRRRPISPANCVLVINPNVWHECNTFITWLCIALLLHARVTFRRMPVSYGWSAVVAIFGLAILTFLGVPFLSIAPHKGVM